MKLTVTGFAQQHRFTAASASKILRRAAIDGVLEAQTSATTFVATYTGSSEAFNVLAKQERARLAKLRDARLRSLPKPQSPQQQATERKPAPPAVGTRFSGGRNPWTGARA